MKILTRLFRWITNADLADYQRHRIDTLIHEAGVLDQDRRRAVVEMNRRQGFRDWLVRRLTIHSPWRTEHEIIAAYNNEGWKQRSCCPKPPRSHDVKFPEKWRGFGV